MTYIVEFRCHVVFMPTNWTCYLWEGNEQHLCLWRHAIWMTKHADLGSST